MKTLYPLGSILLLLVCPLFPKAQILTANHIIQMMQQQVSCDWDSPTVDIFKAGDPQSPVTGIVVTFMPTMAVLEKAAELGANLVIAHEPVFYNHLDETQWLKGDAVLQAKQNLIKEKGLILWRFHDHWHKTAPDGILTGMIRRLGWKSYQMEGEAPVFMLPEQSLQELAISLQKTFSSTSLRVIGDPDMTVSIAAFSAGAPYSLDQIKLLEREEVEVLVAGEAREWETVEYVRDAIETGQKKALILLGHVNSEEGGMEYCTEWLKGFVKDIPIYFVPSIDPFWSPR